MRLTSAVVPCQRPHNLCVVCLDKQTEEKVVDESSSSHCFTDLQQETLYRISVHSRLGSAEGAAVTILHPTGLNPAQLKDQHSAGAQF